MSTQSLCLILKLQWTVLSGQLVWQSVTHKKTVYRFLVTGGRTFFRGSAVGRITMSLWDDGQTRHAHMHAGSDGQYAFLTSGQFLCQTITAWCITYCSALERPLSWLDRRLIAFWNVSFESVSSEIYHLSLFIGHHYEGIWHLWKPLNS